MRSFRFFCSDYLAVYHRVCVDFRLFGTLYLARTHHGLRGSVSPVLTETGLVDGRWQFSTPQNPHPLTNHQNIWYGQLRRQPLWLCQIWCKSAHRRLLGKWVKYNEFFFKFLPIFGIFRQTRRRIFTLNGSNDSDSRKGVPFGGFVDIDPHFWCEILQSTQFRGRE